jgi:hypothetical protein
MIIPYSYRFYCREESECNERRESWGRTVEVIDMTMPRGWHGHVPRRAGEKSCRKVNPRTSTSQIHVCPDSCSLSIRLHIAWQVSSYPRPYELSLTGSPAIALYRALLTRCTSAPLAGEDRASLHNVVRQKFRKNAKLQGPWQLELTFKLGYEVGEPCHRVSRSCR